MSTVLNEVKSLKESAKFSRDFDDYEGAVSGLNKARELLLREHEDWQRRRQDRAQESNHEEYEDRLLSQLADCYGMLGGIYRRQALKAKSSKDRLGNLEKSKEMYLEGLKYENDDSYNLVNTIVVPIIIDRAAYISRREEIKDALKKVEVQVKDKRKDQWWAWADLGLLYLLDGNFSEAISAYAQFKRTGAGPEDYDSTVLVLIDLKESLGDLSQPVVRDIDKAVDYLKINRP